MTSLHKIGVKWTGVNGLPGVSYFYVDTTLSIATAVAAVDQMYQDNNGYIPQQVTIQVDGSGDIIDAATGTLTGGWSVGSPPAAMNGAGANRFAGGVGACLTWRTGTVIAGHKVIGRTFLVPLAEGAYESDGTLSPFCQADLVAHANTMLGSLGTAAGVWHRPKLGVGGQHVPIVSVHVTDQAARLKSRRS